MLIEVARRAEAAAKDMLALVNDGSASTGELREMLAVSKATAAIMAAAQTGAASTVARRENHGDGGTQVLADVAGLSRRDARGQVKTAQAIAAAPAVRDALEDGRVSLANAKRLAEAMQRTSADVVGSDGDLLAKAESMRPEQFAREARRWATQRQADGGEADYCRQRARRYVRVFDTEDGMVRLDGQFDPVTGRRIGNRLQAEARRLYNADKNASRDGEHSTRNGDGEHSTRNGDGEHNQGADNTHNGARERRTFVQCMADALDHLTANTNDGDSKPVADIAVVAHVDGETGRLIAEIAGGDPLPESVLEELMDNAAVTGVIWDTNGTPLWQGQSKRTATAAQRKALIARYGGCFHCGAHPAMCDVHHIRPVSRGGPPTSTTWSSSAGPTTKTSTAAAGESTPATDNTPSTRPTAPTTAPPTPPNNPACTQPPPTQPPNTGRGVALVPCRGAAPSCHRGVALVPCRGAAPSCHRGVALVPCRGAAPSCHRGVALVPCRGAAPSCHRGVALVPCRGGSRTGRRGRVARRLGPRCPLPSPRRRGSHSAGPSNRPSRPDRCPSTQCQQGRTGRRDRCPAPSRSRRSHGPTGRSTALSRLGRVRRVERVEPAPSAGLHPTWPVNRSGRGATASGLSYRRARCGAGPAIMRVRG